MRLTTITVTRTVQVVGCPVSVPESVVERFEQRRGLS